MGRFSSARQCSPDLGGACRKVFPRPGVTTMATVVKLKVSNATQIDSANWVAVPGRVRAAVDREFGAAGAVRRRGGHVPGREPDRVGPDRLDGGRARPRQAEPAARPAEARPGSDALAHRSEEAASRSPSGSSGRRSTSRPRGRGRSGRSRGRKGCCSPGQRLRGVRGRLLLDGRERPGPGGRGRRTGPEGGRPGDLGRRHGRAIPVPPAGHGRMTSWTGSGSPARRLSSPGRPDDSQPKLLTLDPGPDDRLYDTDGPDLPGGAARRRRRTTTSASGWSGRASPARTTGTGTSAPGGRTRRSP